MISINNFLCAEDRSMMLFLEKSLHPKRLGPTEHKCESGLIFSEKHYWLFQKPMTAVVLQVSVIF